MNVIDYGHVFDGVLYHGTISNLDGVPKATWTFEKNGEKVTEDRPIDLPTFRSLWNRVSNLEVFKRNRVREGEKPVDPIADHVISIIFGDKDQPQRVFFAVPAAEADPQFQSWLKSLNVPNQTPARSPAPPAPTKLTSHAADRERVYPKFFGEEFTIDRDKPAKGPAIDVMTFEPGKDSRGRERDFYTLVTSGMSDGAMRVPKTAPFRRAELVLYVEKPKKQHIALLRYWAQLPHLQETTWYGNGTTMTNGQPPQPIFKDSVLDCFLFLEPIVGKDNTLHEKLVFEGDPTTMLWVVPITHAECQSILDDSLDEFLNLLDRKQHPFILDERRKSYVRTRK